MAADKKAVMAILGAAKPSAALPPVDDMGTGAGGDLEAIAGDILDAIQGSDAGALAGALQSFLDVAKG